VSDRYRLQHLLEQCRQAQDLQEFIEAGRRVSKLIPKINTPCIGKITRIQSQQLINKQVENLTTYVEHRAKPTTPPIKVSKSICLHQIERILGRL
jgi:hypothetical protein